MAEAILNQLRGELAQAQAHITQLSAAQEALRTAAQAEIAASEARSAALIAVIGRKQASDTGGGDKFDIVDFKAIQPGQFKGRREESWKLWSRSFKTYCNTRKNGFRKALDWAEAMDFAINEHTIDKMG